jgi:hypothetical protein
LDSLWKEECDLSRLEVGEEGKDFEGQKFSSKKKKLVEKMCKYCRGLTFC